MLDSHYILVFIDMFLGCVVGYLAAPYVNDGLEKLYKKVKKILMILQILHQQKQKLCL